MGFGERVAEIRGGFERSFWVANVSELFERLSYYAAFASLARYLHETLSFPTQRASELSGLFGGLVWFLAIFGGAIADRLGFRRALSLAYLILSAAYFLLGSIGYSIYYTLVNIGGALGPFVASWVHRHMSVENVFRVSSLSVFLMFFVVLLLFREPKKSGEARTESIGVTVRNFGKVLGNGKFMLFLLIFSGYWIVYWQEFVTLPIYVHDYVDSTADTERMLSIDPIVVIAFTVAFSVMTRKMSAFRAVVLGTLVSMLAFGVLGLSSSIWAAYGALVVLAVGELIQQPRYYDYISRLAPAGQQGTYMGFAFLPLGIGSFLGGPIGGALLHYFGEVRHTPKLFPWALVAIGMLTTALLWVYDLVVKPGTESSQPTVNSGQ